jgi:predicted GNAT family N-acyltransferase
MNFTIRSIENADVENAFAVIKKAFDKFVAPGYSDEGVNEFYKYAGVQGLKERISNDIILVAETPEEKIVGVIEIRNHNHICLFFVDLEYHNNGAAKKLLSSALDLCGAQKIIEVNASPYAVPIYEKLGFKKQASEQLTNGIRYIPMTKLR